MPDALPLLVIDDDATTRELLSLLLSHAGWDVTMACGGEEALTALRRNATPAAILSDLHMPGLCGPPLAHAIRDIAAKPVLLAMTATPLPSIPVGYDALLVKPFTPEAVRQLYEAVLMATKTAPATPANPPGSALILDPAVLERLQKSMPGQRLMDLLTFVVNDANARIARMDRAARAGDDAVFRTEAHALKGGCGMVGALHLRDLASKAEAEGLPDPPLTDWKPLAEFVAASAAIRHMLDTLSFGDT